MRIFFRYFIVFILFFILAACKVELNSGLDEKEANEMLSKLLEHNIVAEKRRDKGSTVTILVDKTQFGEAVDLLKKYGLPRQKYANMGDIFSSDSLVSSPTQEWARLNYARTQELSRTISSIPGVISAEVNIANPRKQTSFDEVPPPTASVLVLVAKDAVSANLVPQIKELVSFSLENVEYDRVAVVVSPVDIPAPQPAKFVGFGGVTFYQKDLKSAILMLIGVGLICAVITAAGIVVFLRYRAKKSSEVS